jgi:hypothetical protein
MRLLPIPAKILSAILMELQRSRSAVRAGRRGLTRIFMRIILRNKTTSEYLKETGIYTPVIDDAVDFLSQELATEFCERHKLKEHEILASETEW